MCKLVMIDDNPIEHLMMKKIFARYKIFDDAVHMLNCEIILDFLKVNENNPDTIPDVIFLDLNMPDFNGWDFLEHFEMLSPHLKQLVSIYIISSSIDEKDMVRSKGFPSVKDFISKPVMIDKLSSIYEFHKQQCA